MATAVERITDAQKSYITSLRARATALGITDLAAEKVLGKQAASDYIGRLLAGIRAVEATSAAAACQQRSAQRVEQRLEHRTTGRGVDAAERRINRLQRVDGVVDDGLSMLIYDIPQSMNELCPNPSGLLWHFGFRLNLSCWVLPDRMLAVRPIQRLLDHWAKHNIEVHIIRYHPDALQQIRAIARNKLREEIMRQHESLITRLQAAADRYNKAVAEVDDARKAKRLSDIQDAAVRSILKRAADGLNQAVDCARSFDETETVADLLAGLRGAIRSELDSFNAAMAIKNGKPAEVEID